VRAILRHVEVSSLAQVALRRACYSARGSCRVLVRRREFEVRAWVAPPEMRVSGNATDDFETRDKSLIRIDGKEIACVQM